jgi:hypothetical protein
LGGSKGGYIWHGREHERGMSSKMIVLADAGEVAHTLGI